METQTWLSCHNKFISVKNITILSVSSDDFLRTILEFAEQQTWNTTEIVNRGIRSKCKIYIGIVIRSTILDCFKKSHLLGDPRQVHKLG